MISAIIVAAGRGERMGTNTDKAFLSLGPKPVVVWSLLAFEESLDIDKIVLVVRKEQLVAAKAVVQMFGLSKVSEIVAEVDGAKSRWPRGLRLSTLRRGLWWFMTGHARASRQN